MKLGIHSCTFIQKYGEDETKFFPRLREMGFDVVEVPILNDFSEQRAMKIRKAARENRLEVACCTALPQDADFTGKAVEQSNAVQYLKNCIDFCYMVGSFQLSGVLYAPWGKTNAKMPKRKKWIVSTNGMRKACDYAHKKNVVLCLEVLNRFESDFINTVSEGKEYLQIIDRDNVKLLADTFHANIEEYDTVQAFSKNIDCIGNIHLCEANRDVPQQFNEKWKMLIDSLKGNYNQNVTFECCLKNGTEVANSFSQWQDLTKGQDVFDRISQSASFIKYLIEKN